VLAAVPAGGRQCSTPSSGAHGRRGSMTPTRECPLAPSLGPLPAPLVDPRPRILEGCTASGVHAAAGACLRPLTSPSHAPAQANQRRPRAVCVECARNLYAGCGRRPGRALERGQPDPVLRADERQGLRLGGGALEKAVQRPRRGLCVQRLVNGGRRTWAGGNRPPGSTAARQANGGVRASRSSGAGRGRERVKMGCLLLILSHTHTHAPAHAHAHTHTHTHRTRTRTRRRTRTRTRTRTA